jgi:carbon storage regulator
MLVLSRKSDEQIVIGNDVIVTVIEIRGDKVRLGIEAPPHVAVHRQDVYLSLQREKAAEVAKPDSSVK